mgnify:CR=1 FL=1
MNTSDRPTIKLAGYPAIVKSRKTDIILDTVYPIMNTLGGGGGGLGFFGLGFGVGSKHE